MLADLDLLLIAVFCTADDFLPKRARNARRSLQAAYCDKDRAARRFGAGRRFPPSTWAVNVPED
jgi:hypothetical protein